MQCYARSFSCRSRKLRAKSYYSWIRAKVSVCQQSNAFRTANTFYVQRGVNDVARYSHTEAVAARVTTFPLFNDCLVVGRVVCVSIAFRRLVATATQLPRDATSLGLPFRAWKSHDRAEVVRWSSRYGVRRCCNHLITRRIRSLIDLGRVTADCNCMCNTATCTRTKRSVTVHCVHSTASKKENPKRPAAK